MFFLYQILITILLIFSPLIIFFRILNKKEDKKRYKEKFCFPSKKRINGNLIWFHGSSVGELLSILPLVQELEKNKSINQILITTSTLSSSQIFKKFNFKKCIHKQHHTTIITHQQDGNVGLIQLTTKILVQCI
ncbi:hypothetical protein N8158_02265 [Pelagibacteraceae bacterium]|nr:hypothetical protein [Pelagibacteraceae bacterium]